MRLIDADKLKERKFLTPDAEEAKKRLPAETQVYQQGWNDAIDAIVDNAPTVERPRGKWIPQTAYDGFTYWKCSECGKHNDYAITKFCFHCGADMRKKEEE